LYKTQNSDTSVLSELPTAFDYIRLGHPLSSILEWGIAHMHDLKPEQVIAFSSQTMPVLAVLRKNVFTHKNTQILFVGDLPPAFDFEALEDVYGYNFELKQVKNAEDIPDFDGSTIFISQDDKMGEADLSPAIDFYVSVQPPLGSIILVNSEESESYISEIQHVRRRETIAMTPADSFSALQQFVGKFPSTPVERDTAKNKASVVKSVQEITATKSEVLLGVLWTICSICDHDGAYR